MSSNLLDADVPVMSLASGAHVKQAFMALGGNADKTGEVAISKLEHVLDVFELKVKATDIVTQYDTDKS
eukprot:3992173-Pyramimonas_sp.AAC.1